jgi:hypothetical protein
MSGANLTTVFISYAHNYGGVLAARLQGDLNARGYDTWLDSARIEGGAIWSADIEQAIDGSTVVLALLSNASFRSDVCRGEQLRALRRGECVATFTSDDRLVGCAITPDGNTVIAGGVSGAMHFLTVVEPER